ncbi:tachylectin-related carbohydrate-binding protein [Peribacillus butanolivorans]|uniref:tachylectin-related carbohydrate-binding protein n=1 Tax=Peribacillus butanolivorans TaxID=421767 RepID=UPI0037F63FB3
MITPNGDLNFYYYLGSSGRIVSMDEKISFGWGAFRHVFSDGNGANRNIYAVAQNGDLLYYRDEMPAVHQHQWAYGGIGQKIGTGWGNFVHVFSGGDGIIYAVAQNGDLLYYRDLARDGTSRWANDGVGQIIMSAQATGNFFNRFRHVFSGGDGIIYAIEDNGTILYFRDLAQDGTSRWAYDGIGRKIGTVARDGSRIRECVGVECEREIDLFYRQHRVNPHNPVSPYSHSYFYRPFGIVSQTYIRYMRAFRDLDHLRRNIARLLGRLGYVLIRIGVDEFNNLGVTGQRPGTDYQELCEIWIYHKDLGSSSYEETVLAECTSDAEAKRHVDLVVVALQRMDSPIEP